MTAIDWSYHRPGWKTCGKTQEFLAQSGVTIKNEVNAKKEPHQLEKAKELVAGAAHLYAAKGKKVVEVNLKKESLSDEEIAKLMLGPTGNLRAPTIVKGKILIVGFDEDTYTKVLG